MTTKVEILTDITDLILEVHDVARNIEEFNIPLSIKLRNVAHHLTLIETAFRYNVEIEE